MNPQAFVLSAPGAAAFRPALILGSGLPTEIDGQPVRYAWKESLLLGTYRDAKGKPFDVTPERIDTILRDFGRAKAKGYKPFCPPSHNDRTRNYGFILDARKNEKGGLDLLHQLIGADAHLAAARNGTSICTLRDVTDEHGETYSELIDHQAILPDPQLRGLGPFVFNPAIAASRSGVPLEAEVFTLGAAQKEEPMFPELLKALGLTDGASEAEAIKAVNALKSDATSKGLELSRITTERDTFKADATAKGLELSRNPAPKPLDPEVLHERRLRLDQMADRLADAGYLPADVAKIKTTLLGTEAAPNGLMLSREEGSADCRAAAILGVLAECRPAPKLGIHGIVAARQPTPGVEQDDPEADRREAADWQARQLHSRGLQPLTA